MTAAVDPREHRILRRGGPARTWRWAVAPVVATVVGMHALSGMHATHASGYGTITVFPGAAWLCLAALTTSFVACLRTPVRGQVLLVHLVGLVLLLDGAGPLSEKVARWSISWYTAGFVNQVATTGHVLLHTDARWSWPGFFAAAAALMGPAGVNDADQLLLWTPVVLALAYLVPVLSIASSLSRSTRVPWLAGWIFVTGNWTGQDYFSPQGAIFFLFLAVLAVSLHFFGYGGGAPRAEFQTFRRSGPVLRARALWSGLRRRAEAEAVAAKASPAQQLGAIGVIVASVAAATVAHQLTPVALCLDLAVLSIVGRVKLRALPFLLAAMVALYISFFATDFWSGHLADLFGVTHGGGSSLSQNVSQRIVGNQAHKTVVYLRLAFTATIWLLAAGGVLRRYRQGTFPVTAVACFLAPLALPVVQPYGGEAVIRAFLYGLPFAGVLAAELLLPALDAEGVDRQMSIRGAACLGALLLVALPAYVVAAFGNEQFEEMRPGEVAAVHWFQQHAPQGSKLVALQPDLPGPTRFLADDRWVSVSGPVTESAIVSTLEEGFAPSRFVILTAGEEAYGVVNGGLPHGWEPALGRQLAHDPRFALRFSDNDAMIFEFTGG